MALLDLHVFGTDGLRDKEGELANWGQLTRKLEQLLRLRTFPVAMRLVEDTRELRENPWVRKLEGKHSLCQLITVVRTYDWTVGATADDLMSPLCGAIIGLCERPPSIKEGIMRSMIWCKTLEDAKRCEDSIPTIPVGRFKGVIMAPLAYDPFDPDLILVYGNPAQMILIINAYQFDAYERMQFFCVGESSCSDLIAQAYLTGKPSLTIPCYGERRFAHAQDDELAIAIPPVHYERIVQGLEELYKRGIRYPISPYGASVDPTGGFPEAYRRLAGMERGG